MTSLVPSIVEVLMKKIVLWISNRGNDWTAKSAMSSSNTEHKVKSDLSTVLWNAQIENVNFLSSSIFHGLLSSPGEISTWVERVSNLINSPWNR